MQTPYFNNITVENKGKQPNKVEFVCENKAINLDAYNF